LENIFEKIGEELKSKNEKVKMSVLFEEILNYPPLSICLLYYVMIINCLNICA